MTGKSVVKIQHIIQFFNGEEKFISRGENAVDANHIRRLNYDGDQSIIDAVVDASMKDKFYKVQIMLEKTGEIRKGRCQCPRGLARCHHMAAVLIYALKNISITDGICKWNYKNTQSKKQSESISVDELFPAKDFRATASIPKDLRENSCKDLLKTNTIVGYTWLLNPECTTVQTLQFISLEDIFSSSEYKNCNKENRFNLLKEKCRISIEDIKLLAIETIGQSSNWKWTKYRKGRLTASNFGPIISAVKRNKYPLSLFKRLNNEYNFEKVRQVQWGLQNEKTAISEFEIGLKKKVHNTGLWLHPSGLFGASPDGLVVNEDGTTAIVEIKCPFQFRNCFLKESLKNTDKYVLYIDESGLYQLNKNHNYYHQIQGQMAILDLAICYLVIWTSVDIIVIDVHRDVNWNYLNVIENFFINKWLPYIENKY